jgi:hypothetical protein
MSVMERLLEALAKPYEYSGGRKEYAQPPKESDVPYRTYCGT